MTKQTFDAFMAGLVVTNSHLGDFCDFDKIASNVRRVYVSLHTLNALLACDDFEAMVRTIWEGDPEVFKALPLLLALRPEENKGVLSTTGELTDINSYLGSPETILDFLRESGLKHFVFSGQVRNLVDYVFGIEVGLDSNARKNRVGYLMEKYIATKFDEAGIVYEQEVYSSTFPEVSEALGVDKKRFDFVVKTELKTYLIEVNFYNSGGSKLNEVARSYSEIAPKVNALKGFEFIWVTDGQGWHSAKNKLCEAYEQIPNIYNLATLGSLLCRLRQKC